MVSESLITETQHASGVVELRLNRPSSLNAFNTAMYKQMAEALNRCSADKATRIVVITASGKTFCSGMDIREASDKAQSHVVIHAASVFMRALVDCPKVVIAAVFGRVTGIGVTLLLHCDIVVVDGAAIFETPFSSVGLVPEFASSVLFPKFFGPAIAARLLLRGDTVSAVELERVGCAELATGEVTKQAVRDAIVWSRSVGDLEWQSVEMAKKLMRDPLRKVIRQAIAEETVQIDGLLQQGVVQRLMGNKVAALRRRRSRL